MISGSIVAALLLAIVLAVLLGYPVAIALGGVSLVVGYFMLGPAFLQFLPSRYMGVLSNYVLLAVPMFILMGIALQRSRLAEVLLQACAKTFGKRPGGLALSVLVVGAALAASTGIVGASVVTLGLIALPVMKQAGYRDDVAAGIVASAGSLGQIVPPSIVLILLASVMQVSVGALFAKALTPSLLIIGGYALYLLGMAWWKPAALPAQVQPIESQQPVIDQESTPHIPLWLAVLGPVVLIGGVLGSILLGVASPTEASGFGAALGLCLFGLSGKRTLNAYVSIGREALRLTAMVFLILLGATTFALVFRGLGGDDLLVQWITEAGLSQHTFLLLVLLTVFIAGFFIDFIEIIFIVVPVVLPILTAFEVDPLWFAILLGINLQTSFLTPPFGFSLFYLRGVAPASMTTPSIYKGVLPYIAIQLTVLAYVFWLGA